MDKAYIVTRGPHDDFHILAIYSSRDRANGYAETYNRYRTQDELPVEVKEYIIDEITDFTPVTTVYLDKNGDVVEFFQEFPGKEGFGGWACGSGIYPGACPTEDCYLIWGVRTEDKEEAKWTANEKRERLIDENRWGKVFDKVIV
jgi:hypothetical protein